MKEAWIRFMAPVTPRTAEDLCMMVGDKINKKYDRLHIMMSSDGGTIVSGIAAYNFLKNCPIDIEMYNFGNVDSIAVTVFCSGSKRYAAPMSRFIIHEVTWAVNNFVFNTAALENLSVGLELNPIEAKNYGLIHETRENYIPKGAEILSIGDPFPDVQNIANQSCIIQDRPHRIDYSCDQVGPYDNTVWKPASSQAQGTGPRYYCGTAPNHGQFIGTAPSCCSQIR
jgi:hypothetical protein